MAKTGAVDYVAMGKRIRTHREEKGWTQSELAFRVHMSNTTISHIEVGTGKPELNTLVRIANVLGVTVDMLLCESLEASDKPYKCEISEFLNSCSAEELRLVSNIVPVIINAFRRECKMMKNKYVNDID